MDTVADIGSGNALELLCRDHSQQVGIHICAFQPGRVLENITGISQGANYDGHIGLLGDLEYTAAEGVQQAVQAGITL